MCIIRGRSTDKGQKYVLFSEEYFLSIVKVTYCGEYMSRTVRRKNDFLRHLSVDRWYLPETDTISFKENVLERFGNKKKSISLYYTDSRIAKNSKRVQFRGVQSNKKVRNQFKKDMAVNFKTKDYEDFEFSNKDLHKKYF